MSPLRFITCGGVDDGKSTLVDSLAAECEQGIATDVAHRFFSTDRRKFIVADTPGHEQDTRNLLTGASTADVAVILVDARKGVLTQTRRHSFLVSLVGIRKVALAINKMDLVDHAEQVFRDIDAQYRSFAAQVGPTDVVSIPLSALRGDNIVAPSEHMPWYRGPTLMGYLENVEVEESSQRAAALRLPVQSVNRSNPDFRGYSGLVASGTIQPGDRVRVQPSGRENRVARIVAAGGDLPMAVAGQSITITLADDVDVSRGDVISAAASPAEVADQFEATLVWMSEDPMLPGRTYLMQIGTRLVNTTATELKYRVNVDTLEHLAARKLELNEIGVCNLALDAAVPFDAYAVNRETGGFMLIDRMSNNPVGAGMLHFALRRSHNIHPQHVDIDKHARALQKSQRPCVLWFTGLSGAGKSTIANLVEKRLHAMGRHTYLLDGDNLRHGLNKDLGFTAADRVENIRRVAEVARLMVDAGLIVLTAFISPFRAERDMARAMYQDGEFVEIHVDTPLAIAELRDPKGLYRKARLGELRNFTGVDSPYEVPENPELRVNAVDVDADVAADVVLARLVELGLLD